MSFEQAAAVPLVFVTGVAHADGAGEAAAGRRRAGAGCLERSRIGGDPGITKCFSAGSSPQREAKPKLAKARELGADYVIDHYQQDISAEVRKITAKRGVDTR